MTKNTEKFFPSHNRIPFQSLSHEEIFQFLKNTPMDFPQKRLDENVFHEVFFHFFIDYFYMKENIDLKDFLNSLERAILVKMLDRFNGNQKNTAAFLRLKHTTLNQKVRKHKIDFFKRPIEG